MANRKTIVTLNKARALPRWRQPVALLLLMAFAMPLAFSTWSALPRVRARRACATSAQGAKYQRFGARRQGWFPCQATRATEMKRLARPQGLADFRPDRVTGP